MNYKVTFYMFHRERQVTVKGTLKPDQFKFLDSDS